MAKIKVINIISDIDRWVSFEWLTERLNPEKFEPVFILLNTGDSYFERYLKDQHVKCYRVYYRSKRDLIPAMLKVIKILRTERPHCTHSHFLPGGIIGLTASFLAGIKRRIYTRRHGSQHNDYAKRGLYYDKYMNFLATQIIATGKNVEKILLDIDHAPAKKVSVVYHGFNFSDFNEVSQERIDKLRQKFAIQGKGPVIGVISRFVELKGVQYIVPAFKKYLEKYPNAVLLMTNCFGDYMGHIDQQLSEIPESSYRKIYFEEDVFAFYKLLDAFVHVPINSTIEAFGQIYIEALASKVPSIFTLSGVSKEFVRDGHNALVVPFKSSNEIYEGLIRLSADQGLRQRLIKNGYDDVYPRFSIERMVAQLEAIYSLE